MKGNTKGRISRTMIYIFQRDRRDVMYQRNHVAEGSWQTGYESPISKRAGEVIHEIMKKDGSVECDKLQEMCLLWSRHEAVHSEAAKEVK
jgi:hypothetical protein